MYLIQHEGIPSIYYLTLIPLWDSQVALDFDPPSPVLRLNLILTYGCLLFLCSPVDRLLRLRLFKFPVVSTEYPFYLIKMVTKTLFYFLSLLVGFPHHVRRRSSDSRRQPHSPTTLVVAT